MVDFAEDHFERDEQPTRLRQRSRPLFGPRSGSTAGRLRRLGLAIATLVLTLTLFGALAAGLLLLRLSHGPIAVALEKQVSTALAARVRHGFRFDVGGTAVQSTDGRPTLVVDRLVVEDDGGRTILKAPRATLSVDPLQMLGGTIVPTRLDIQDVSLKLVILPDGDVALSAGTDDTLPFRLSEALESAAPSPSSSQKARLEATGSLKPDVAGKDAFDRLAAALIPALDAFTGNSDVLAGFNRLGIARGQLLVDDRAHNSVERFKDLSFEFERPANGMARLSMTAAAGGLHWSATVNGTRREDGSRSLAVGFENVTMEDLRLIPGLRDPGFETDLPLATSLNLELDKAGLLTGLAGSVKLGSGFFKLNDPDHEPIAVNGVTAPFHFDVASRNLVVEPTTIETETGRYRFGGRLSSPRGPAADWAFEAQGDGIVGPERPNEGPIVLNQIDAGMRIDTDLRRLVIDKLAVVGPQVDLKLTGEVSSGPDGLHVATQASAGKMPAPIILRLWPTTLSAAVRAWLLVHLQGGTVERGSASATLDAADLAKMKLNRSVADGHLKVDYTVSGVTLAFMDGVPPLRALAGTGVVTGDTSRFTVSHGSMDVSPGRTLALPDGSLFVPSTDPKPTPAVITAHVVGGIDALTDLLSRDALKSYADLPSEAASAKGQIDGTLTVGLNLGAHARSDDVKIGANARITGLAVDKIVGKQNLTDGTVTLSLDKQTGLHAAGTATVAGATTTLDIKKPSGDAPAEANVQMVFDDAARAKAGFDFGRSLTGPVTAKITANIGGSDKKANVDLDLGKASLTNVMPGLSKPAGKPGRVTLVATQRDKGTDLDKIVCDIGAFSLRGSADLDAAGAFQSAKLSQLRISPGDDLKADVIQGQDGLKLVVRGANLDARPFLKTLSDPDDSQPGRDVDLDLRTGVLTGQNSQVITNADLKMVRRGGTIRKLEFNGKLGKAALQIGSTMQGNVLAVSADSGDAGATLLFLDLYKRLARGRLQTTIRVLNGHWDGSAVVHEFGLREDPAMKRLTEQSLSEGKGNMPNINADDLSFTKMFVVFSKTGTKLDVKEGNLFSPEMGATVQGSIDFGHDKLALAGTFVPIYGVNNLFSQVPLVGPILGGGANEGLFGLNYKINGSVANPNLTIDPLSALAPGFLRKIFGAISDAAAEPGAPTPNSKSGQGIDPVAR